MLQSAAPRDVMFRPALVMHRKHRLWKLFVFESRCQPVNPKISGTSATLDPESVKPSVRVPLIAMTMKATMIMRVLIISSLRNYNLLSGILQERNYAHSNLLAHKFSELWYQAHVNCFTGRLALRRL